MPEWVGLCHPLHWHSFCLFKLLLIGSALTSPILSIIPQHPSTGRSIPLYFHPPASISLPSTRPQARNRQGKIYGSVPDLWVPMQSSFVQLESNNSAHQPLMFLRLHSSLFLSGSLGSPHQEHTRGPSPSSALRGLPPGSRCTLSPPHFPQPFLLCRPRLQLEGPRSPELCLPSVSLSSCSFVGARVNVPQGHGLLLPCCFMTVRTQPLRLSAHLCICLDSSQQVFKLRKSDAVNAITCSVHV